MNKKMPKVNVDILVVRDNKILLGHLTEKWNYQGNQVYGVPGRDILFGETIGDAAKRSIKEDLGCKVIAYRVIAVNANFALENHYIGIGILVEMKGKIKNLKLEDWEKWEWFEEKKIPNNLFPAAKNVIDSYLEEKFIVSE